MKQPRILSNFSRLVLPMALVSCSTRCSQVTQSTPIQELPQAVSSSSHGTEATHSDVWRVGIGTHLMWNPESVVWGLGTLKNLGAVSLREDIPWSVIEPQRGARRVPTEFDVFVDTALASNVEPLLILDYGHPDYPDGTKPQTAVGAAEFANYAQSVARHFGQRVSLYEVWNEWDGTTGNTQPASADTYANLARVTYSAVKAVAPHSKVLVGAATSDGIDKGFLRRIVELGALDWSDGLSLHSYIHCRGDTRPEVWYAWVQQQHDDVAKLSNKPFDMYITEMGWPAHDGKCGVHTQTQAKYLARTLLLGRTLPYLKGLWWYDLVNDGPQQSEAEHNFGIFRHDRSAKPAAMAFAKVAPIVARMSPTQIWKPAGETLWGVHFEAGADNVWAFWSSDEDQCFSVEVAASGPLEQRRVLAPVDRPAGTKSPSGTEILYVSDEVLLVSSQAASFEPRAARESKCGAK